MKSSEINKTFTTIQLKWNILILMKVLIITLSTSLLFFQLVKHLQHPYGYTFIFAISLASILGYYFGLGRVSQNMIAQLMDRQLVSLEDSSHLLLQEDNLTSIGKVQQGIIANRLFENVRSLKYPVKYKGAILVAILFVVSSYSLQFITDNLEGARSNFLPPVVSEENELIEEITSLGISHFEIEVTPPSYTRLPSGKVSDMHLEIPANSRVKWKLYFNKPVNQARFIWGLDESFTMNKREDYYYIESRIPASGFYSFSIQSEDTLKTDFYRVDVIPDLPPKILPNSAEVYSRIEFRNDIRIPVSATISDDYGLSDAYIVATVSKGSGEGVKFREEKVLFDLSLKGKKFVDVSTNLLGEKLELEPGSELYYYIEAWDNKTPNPNRSRTETYFVVVEDTAKAEFGDFGGLAVDLMPDYFRSQRQIIIETEKLIKDKPQLAEKDFKFISNELGFDQKVLRLKYSQFLGEEFESGIELEDSETPPNDEALQILEESHEHDDELNPNEEEDLLESVSHAHDTEEETSYYSISVEAKLRATLTEMWSAELYLRLYKPAQSLPYQYRALELIKEIKNHARIYVKRVGFEPPPLTEEKRLQGKQDEINPITIRGDRMSRVSLNNVTLATTILDNAILSERQLTENERNILKACGNEIAYLVEINPLRYLDLLQDIKKISERENSLGSELSNLRKDLYQIMETQANRGGTKGVLDDPLKKEYFKINN